MMKWQKSTAKEFKKTRHISTIISSRKLSLLFASEIMAHLHTSLVLLLFLCSLWPSDGMIHFTHLGTKCIDACKPVGREYKCKSTDEDGKVQTMYCSPSTDTDYWGRWCYPDTTCDTGGEGYYWCKPDALSWGYCGMVADDKNYYGSKTGAMCYSNCYRRGQDYYLCNTAQGRDYCSPFENTDYKNRQCKEDSPCGKQGKDYNWCWLKEGGWGLCGPMEPKMFLHRSMNDHFCIDECQYYESGDYYWCHTDGSWDYCSPDVNVTYKDKPCRSDHSCGLHGYSYNWCWTSETEYDYCGPIESGECTYVTSQHHNRGILKDIKLICMQEAERKITTFNAEPTADNIADGSQWKSEAQILISRWDNRYLVDKALSNLIDSNNLRIDMVGTMEDSELQPYYDLRIRVKQGPGESTTVSQIIVAPGIPERFIRRAFLESFRRRARVTVQDSKHPALVPWLRNEQNILH